MGAKNLFVLIAFFLIIRSLTHLDFKETHLDDVPNAFLCFISEKY